MVSHLLFLAQLQIVSWKSRSSDKFCFAQFHSKTLKNQWCIYSYTATL